MAKGSNYERTICKTLSNWWTKDRDDGIFWRTSNSGGRATVRGRKGKKTTGQAGDICAIDPVGKPFVDRITLEVKRGYPAASLHALLDKPAKAKPQIYETWIAQAKASQKEAGTPFWGIIHQRDRRETIMTIPGILWYGLSTIEGPFIEYSFSTDTDDMPSNIIVSFPFAAFLKCITPETLVECVPLNQGD